MSGKLTLERAVEDAAKDKKKKPLWHQLYNNKEMTLHLRKKTPPQPKHNRLKKVYQ